MVMRIVNHKFFIWYLYFISIFFPFAFEESLYHRYIYINYTIQLFFLLYFISIEKKQIQFLLSPSILSNLYLIICFILGDLLFRNDLYLLQNQYLYYLSWEHTRISCCYYNATFFVILLSFYFSRATCFKDNFLTLKPRVSLKNIIFLISILVILLMSGFQIFVSDSSTIDLAGICSTVIACFLFIQISKSISPFRFLFYILIVALFAMIRFDNKREAIFLFLPVFLLEAPKITTSIFTLKNILYSVCIIVFVSFLIFFMSLKRAEKNGSDYRIESAFDIVPALLKYLSSDNVLPIIADNFEVNYVYINSHQAIEFVEKDSRLLTYGGTYLKPFFLPISRTVFPDKPEAVITLYTREFDSAAAASGYCLPLSLHTESFWNFSFWGGIICCYFIFFVLNSLYKYFVISLVKNNCLANILFLYLYYIFFILYRDAGFEKVILWFPVSYFFLIIIRSFRII